MKKFIILLISLCFLLGGCKKQQLVINKTIIPNDFKTKLETFTSYNQKYLHQYYYSYLDNNSFIYALNSVNYPEFYNSQNKNIALVINEIILVNRKFYLEKDYIPDDLIPVTDVSYVKRSNEVMVLNKEALEMYQLMEKFAQQKNIDLLLFSAYRSYEKQQSLWTPGRLTGDAYLALPGFSEHQTGLAIDIGTIDSGLTLNFENTETFNFLKNEAHKFGFILRYPKDKIKITGYAYEPWHFRYVGKEIATTIWSQNLTLEEYFYHYLELSQ